MKQYLDLLQDILDNGEDHEDRTGVGTKSVFGRQLRFDLSEGFPLMTTKRLAFRWIAEELFWFLSGSTDAKKLKDKDITIWDEWSTAEKCGQFFRKENDLGPIYGHTWRNFGASFIHHGYWEPKEWWSNKTQRWINPSFNDDGWDQVAVLVDQLAKKSNSRRLIVTGWDPQYSNEVCLPPCHTMWQVKIDQRKSLLHMHLTQRSSDFCLGSSFNIPSYALLTHLLAHVCGLQVGDFVYTMVDCHLYKNHLEAAKEQLSRKPLALPALKVNSQLTGNPLSDLLNIKYEDLELINYQNHGKLKTPTPVAV